MSDLICEQRKASIMVEQKSPVVKHIDQRSPSDKNMITNYATTRTEPIIKDDPTRHPDRYHPHFLFYYFMGDCEFQLDTVESLPVWAQTFFWFLRAVGAPIFLNNPWSGLLILIAMFISNPWTALCGCLGLITAILTALFLGQERATIVSGSCTFHGMLCGVLCAASLMTESGQALSWQVPFVSCLLAIMSVYVNSGIVCVSSVVNLPALNLPFNLTMFVFLGALGAGNSQFLNGGGGATNYWALGQMSGPHSYDSSIAIGIPKALAQIYGSDELVHGIMVLVAIAIYSPLLAVFAILAGFVSILTAVLINIPPAAIATGAWSYNAVLTTCATGSFFWVLSWQTAILSLFAGVFATLVHALLVRLLVESNVPALALASNISIIFLMFASNSNLFVRTPMSKITYPEEHFFKWGGSDKNIEDNSI